MSGGVATFAAACALAAVHAFALHVPVLHATPRSPWLSFGGGLSIAYVFVHLLPQLAEHQDHAEVWARDAPALVVGIENPIYLLALIGLATFYGLEQHVRSIRSRSAKDSGQASASDAAFRLHLVAFAIYNVLLGYLLLHREDDDIGDLVLYLIAVALHLLVNDRTLREAHGQSYDAYGRWLLAAAPLLGWGLGLAIILPAFVSATVFAFLTGAIVLNVLKEELPEEHDASLPAFVCGSAAFAALLTAAG